MLSRARPGSHRRSFAAASPEKDRSHILALDGLRGIAALLVLFCHCVELPAFVGGLSPPLDWHRNGITEVLFFSPLHLLWDGEDAVVFFFVLSGFVLSLSFLDGRAPSYGRFLIRRFFRLYPALLIAILLSSVIVLAFAPVRNVALSPWLTGQSSSAISIAIVAGHLLLLGSPVFESLDVPIWSLVHEARISVVFPFMMMVLCRSSFRFGLMALGVFLGSILASHTITLGPVAYDLMRSFHYLIFFALGAGLARYRGPLVAWVSGLPASQRLILLMAGLLAVSGRWTFPFGATAADISTGLGSAAIIVLALSWPALARQLATRVCGWLGRISYSLYLIHVPVIAFWVYLLQGKAGLGACILTAIPTALAAAHIMAKAVEVPAVDLGRRLTQTAERDR